VKATPDADGCLRLTGSPLLNARDPSQGRRLSYPALVSAWDAVGRRAERPQLRLSNRTGRCRRGFGSARSPSESLLRRDLFERVSSHLTLCCVCWMNQALHRLHLPDTSVTFAINVGSDSLTAHAKVDAECVLGAHSIGALNLSAWKT